MPAPGLRLASHEIVSKNLQRALWICAAANLAVVAWDLATGGIHFQFFGVVLSSWEIAKPLRYAAISATVAIWLRDRGAATTSWEAHASRPVVIALFVTVAWCASRDLSYARDLVAHVKMGNMVGWDLLPTCRGLATFAAGSNPYVVGNLNHASGPAAGMTFPYPIAGAYPAKILCLAQDVLPNAHLGIYLAILAGSCAALAYSLWRSTVEVAWVMLAAVSAFSAYRWLALTGNIAIFEVPFAALSVAALHRRRYMLSGVALGLMSTLKVLPLVGALAFLVLPIEWPKRLHPVAAAGLAFAAFHLVNAVISGPYAWSFYAATFGQIPGQPGLAGEPGGLNNPNFIDFAFALFAKLGLGTTTPAVSAIAFCAMAAGAAIVLLAHRTADMGDDATVRLFGVAVLVGNLFLFRLKPYAYGSLVPFAIAAVAFPNRAMRCVGYLVLAAVPALFVGRNIDIDVSVYAYFQTVSLLAFLAAAAGLNAYWLAIRTDPHRLM